MQTLSFANGDQMPVLGLGTWKATRGVVGRAVQDALRLGFRHLDCATIYANEAEIGAALGAEFAAGTVARQDLWLTSKLWNNAHAAADVRPALEATLTALGVDELDLYLMHWPVAVRRDVVVPQSADQLIGLDELPLLETWGAMEDALEAGLCRHLGVSNFSLAKVEALLRDARVRPEMNQVELHPYLQQQELVDGCRGHGVHVTAYSPLGSPDRPPGMKKADEPVLLEDPALADLARQRGVTPAQLAIAWAVQRGTAVIPKTVRPERMQENLAAAEVALGEEEMAAIAGLDRARRYVDGEFWAMEGGPYTVAGLWDE